MKNFLVLKIYDIFKIIMKNLTAVKRWKPVCMDPRLTPTALNVPESKQYHKFQRSHRTFSAEILKSIKYYLENINDID